jgi:hypothetical protein
MKGGSIIKSSWVTVSFAGKTVLNGVCYHDKSIEISFKTNIVIRTSVQLEKINNKNTGVWSLITRLPALCLRSLYSIVVMSQV